MTEDDLRRDTSAQSYTLMLMPDSAGGEIRRLRISRRIIRFALGSAAFLVIAAGLSFAGNYWLWNRSKAKSAPVVVRPSAESAKLEAQLGVIDDRVRRLDKDIERVRDLEARLRAMTQVSDPDRNLAIGPVGAVNSESPLRGADSVSPELRMELLGGVSEAAAQRVDARVSAISVEAGEVERDVRRLSLLLKNQRAMLASVPSRRPSNGYITSQFGMRTDPFTGLQQLHAGIDFAAEVGAHVNAPADGRVIYARRRGAYGKMVELQHLNGVTTRFAHLSEIHVREGQKVRRGELLGAIGNTGRSTGPHLHYEVRLNGVPQDPARFILD